MEIVDFVGANGSGKSTTIRTLLNFIFSNFGTGKILWSNIVKESKYIKKYIRYVPSEIRLYNEA